MTVTVIIPVYNERETLPKILDRVMSSGIGAEQILIVDDGSTDGTAELLHGMDANPLLEVIRHPQNRGKGAAIATAMPRCTGDVVVIQDADLEYDPADLPELLA